MFQLDAAATQIDTADSREEGTEMNEVRDLCCANCQNNERCVNSVGESLSDDCRVEYQHEPLISLSISRPLSLSLSHTHDSTQLTSGEKMI